MNAEQESDKLTTHTQTKIIKRPCAPLQNVTQIISPIPQIRLKDLPYHIMLPKMSISKKRKTKRWKIISFRGYGTFIFMYS